MLNIEEVKDFFSLCTKEARKRRAFSFFPASICNHCRFHCTTASDIITKATEAAQLCVWLANIQSFIDKFLCIELQHTQFK